MRRMGFLVLAAVLAFGFSAPSQAASVSINVYSNGTMGWVTAQSAAGVGTVNLWVDPGLVLLELEPDGVGGAATVPEVAGLQAIAEGIDPAYCGGAAACQIAESDAGPGVTNFGTGQFIQFFKGAQASLDQAGVGLETFLGKITLGSAVNSTVYNYPATAGQIAFASGTDASGAAFTGSTVTLIPLGAPVPEPTSALLLGAGLMGLALLRRRA